MHIVKGVKESLHELADQLPEGATWEVVIHKVEALMVKAKRSELATEEDIRILEDGLEWRRTIMAIDPNYFG